MNVDQKKCPKCKHNLKFLPSSGRYACSCGWTSQKQQNHNFVRNTEIIEKQKYKTDNNIQENEQEGSISEEMEKLKKYIAFKESHNDQGEQFIRKYAQIIIEVKSHLDDNESISEILLLQPISWGRLFMEKTESITVATSKRVIMFTPGTVAGYNMESLNYHKISSIDMKEGIAYDEIKLGTSGNEIEIKNIFKGNTLKFIKYVRTQIARFEREEQNIDHSKTKEEMFNLAIKEIIAIRKEMEKINKKTDFLIQEIYKDNVIKDKL